MSKTTLIVNATPCPNGTEALAHYTKHAGAILKAHHGKLVNKYKITDILTKEKFNQNVMVMEFENDTIIDVLTKGKEYQALIPYRDKAFSDISIVFAQTI
jgi:uncharacterized protein (DUF1330 family)